MKSYKTTKEQIDFIIKGVDRFISYANTYCNNKYYRDMEETNNLYKQNPETFFSDIGINQGDFFKRLSYYRLLDIAYKVRDDIGNIHNNVISIFINPEGNEYPIKVKEWLLDFKYFCYNDRGNLLSLEEQNNRLKNYYHFDASTKRPKTYNTQ